MHPLNIFSKPNVTSNYSGGSTATDYFAGNSRPLLYNIPNHTPPLPPGGWSSMLPGPPASCWVWPMGGHQSQMRRCEESGVGLFSLLSPCFTAVSDKNSVPSQLCLLSSGPPSMTTAFPGLHYLFLLSFQPGQCLSLCCEFLGAEPPLICSCHVAHRSATALSLNSLHSKPLR